MRSPHGIAQTTKGSASDLRTIIKKFTVATHSAEDCLAEFHAQSNLSTGSPLPLPSFHTLQIPYAVAEKNSCPSTKYFCHQHLLIMPRKSDSKTQSLQKHRLSLAQLASYDDVLTDALVDQVRSQPEQVGASLTSHRLISGHESAKIAKISIYRSGELSKMKCLRSSFTRLS
jgi:hypothetical protein